MVGYPHLPQQRNGETATPLAGHLTVLAERSRRDFWIAVAIVIGMAILHGRGQGSLWNWLAMLALLLLALLQLSLHRSLRGAIRRLEKTSPREDSRARAFAECAADGYWEVDADLRITDLSAGFARHAGVAAADLLGRLFPDVLEMAVTDQDRRMALLRLLEQRQPFQDRECRIMDAAGRRQDGFISGRPVYSEDQVFAGYVGVWRKTTPMPRADAREEASCLANMSHEIRTPINAVLGIARMGWRDSQDERQRLRWQRVLSASRHMLWVVNDILDFSKMEAGKIRVEQRPFKLARIIDNACDLVETAAHEKGLNCTRDEECPHLEQWVLGDAHRLQQILANLLSNAVKFTHSGEIRLRVARDGDLTHFRVLDTGIGMTPEQLSRLFQPYEQADPSITRRYGGSGLGLAISRDLARLMGGDITVDSALGQGSAFTLSLPLPETAPASDQDLAPILPDQPRLAGMRILVADDEEIGRMILQDMLESEGAIVQFAADGGEAVDKSREAGPYDLILMDTRMPVMDGLEATKRILEATPEQLVIGLSANVARADYDLCLAAGMRDYVTKPFDPDALLATILRVSGAPPLKGTPGNGRPA